MGTITIQGSLVGRRVRRPFAEIVRIAHRVDDGPAENAFVLVCSAGRARYLSWIGYYDVEYAQSLEPGVWAVIEPPKPYKNTVEWLPYGWDGAERVPAIGDATLRAGRV